MRAKPRGAKYRNLTARSGVIYYQRRVNGKRIRFSCETNDWGAAAAVARLYEERKGFGRLPFASIEVPRFAEGGRCRGGRGSSRRGASRRPPARRRAGRRLL